MVVEDVIPASMVEKPGFKKLMSLVEPKYTMVSRQHLQYTLLPKKAQSLQESIKQKLVNVPSCAVTLDNYME